MMCLKNCKVKILFVLLMNVLFLLLGIASCNLNSAKVVPTEHESDTMPTISKCRIGLDSYSNKEVYINYDTAPSFGEKGNDLGKYIYDNFDQGKNKPFQGAFSMACIINKEGEVCYPRVVKKKETEYSSAEKEFIRVLSSMPKWNPGKCDGKVVDCLVYVPLIF